MDGTGSGRRVFDEVSDRIIAISSGNVMLASLAMALAG